MIAANLYIVLYLEILILCFVIAAILHNKASHDLGSEGEVRAFRWILRLYMVMMVLDSIAQMQFQRVIRPPVIIAEFASGAYMALLSLLAVFWFIFAELQIAPSMTRNTRFRILFALPGVAMAFMSFASIRTGWFFHYDDTETFRRGSLFFVQLVVAYFYFVFTTVHAYLVAKKEQSFARRQRLKRISLFIIAPTIGALLQLVIGGYPFVGPSIIIAVLIIFIRVQADMIQSDSLTGLNNRKSMEQYLEEILPGISEENPLYFFMIDADRFKKINDTYGHLEGDRALKLIAEALRMTANRTSGFIARLGGDEFVAINDTEHIQSPEAFEEMLLTDLAAVKTKAALPYDLSVSIGHCFCDGSVRLTADLLSAADKQMYLVKQEKHAAQRR
ncbi:MAG: GGDEF domain-containing protein [Lachnospiraceae bacterium]|nr:GGDEF domain-containing protein [Lachnospiraceae bacterium]